MTNNTSSLILGTVQLGMSYGIANKSGQPDQAHATAIIEEAWKGGVCEFDTAQAYGESERVLGNALDCLGIAESARVISKLDPRLNHLHEDAVCCAVEESLERLGVRRLHCLMLHSEDKVEQWDKGLSDILARLVSEDKVRHIGVSVYSPGKAVEAIMLDGVDIVQLPSNILDRRFERVGVFARAAEMKKEIHIRSVFLQGLILMKQDDVPTGMVGAKSIVNEIDEVAREYGLEREELALGYLRTEHPEAKIIFGAEESSQVRANVHAWSTAMPEGLNQCVQQRFFTVDETILNPALWSQIAR